MKKEIPILFTTPMVQAILAGRKTMTRRIINPQPIIDQDSGFVFDGKHRKQYDIHNWQELFIDDFSRWMPEDWLWIRESGLFLISHPTSGWIYKADDHQNEDEIKKAGYRWKPSIHMPKEASRIWLEVTNIKAERLQNITEEDAIAEGIETSISGNGRIVYKHYLKDKYGPSPIHSYETLWRKINGEDSWKENPWVWVIEFKELSRIGKPKQIIADHIIE